MIIIRRATTDRVDSKVSLCVRQNIADHTIATVEELSPQTNLANGYGLNEDRLFAILLPVFLHFEIVVTPLLKQVKADCHFDERGCLTDESKTRLKEILPSFPADDWEELFESDVFMSVAFIEALVTAGIDLRKEEVVDIADLPIGGLDERQQRLLLIGTFRFLWQSGSNDRMRLEMSDALNALEVFADTGKTKTALNRARSNFRGTFINSRKPWRNAPESIAIDTALTNGDLKTALMDMVRAMKAVLELSPHEALNRLGDLALELVAPVGLHETFRAKWRSPGVVELAQEMYSTRNFSKTHELADALQEVGCDNDQILNHCRDANHWHMRGCWVIDAILDGSWAIPVKKRRRKKKLLFDRLPQSAQLSIRREAEFCFVDLEFDKFIAKLWDVETFESGILGNTSTFVEKRRSKVAEKFPSLTAEQVESYLSFQQIDRRLQRTCIARRVLREDPSEVARGLSVLYRVRDAMLGPQLQQFDDVGPLCSTHHWDIARTNSIEFLSRTVDKEFKNFDYIDLRQFAYASIIADDSELLPRLWSEMTKRKKPPWLTAWYVALKAIADRDPLAVAVGLQDFLARFRRLNRDHDAVVNFDAHGLYRLAESLDPKLVAQFDALQGYPWDADFHAWCAANPDPLSAIDFTGLSSQGNRTFKRLEMLLECL